MSSKAKKNIQQKKSDDPYRLKDNLDNIRQRSNHKDHYQTNGKPGNGFANPKPIEDNITPYTHTESIRNDSYYYLDSKITTLNDKNESSHNTLRQELEVKIDKKLDMQWYVYTIAALVVIIVLIWTLSYSNLISDVKGHTNFIDSLKNDSQNIRLKK